MVHFTAQVKSISAQYSSGVAAVDPHTGLKAGICLASHPCPRLTLQQGYPFSEKDPVFSGNASCYQEPIEISPDPAPSGLRLCLWRRSCRLLVLPPPAGEEPDAKQIQSYTDVNGTPSLLDSQVATLTPEGES